MGKNIEDSIKDGLIIIIGATGIFFALIGESVKSLKVSLNAMDIMALAGMICGTGIYERLCNLQKMDQRVIQQQIL